MPAAIVKQVVLNVGCNIRQERQTGLGTGAGRTEVAIQVVLEIHFLAVYIYFKFFGVAGQERYYVKPVPANVDCECTHGF